MQQRLSLSWAATSITRVTIRLDLADVSSEGFPALDLTFVLLW
jgi:hypothetical protein